MLKKFLKFLGILTLSAVGLTGLFVAWTQYDAYKRDKADLSFETGRDWQWHSKSSRIQISPNEETGRSTLRKVHKVENYSVYAFKDDDYKVIAAVLFHVNCDPGAIIVTSKKYSGGEPKTLECRPSGEALMHSFTISEDASWFTEDLDGFKYSVNFSDWDFSKLNQEITLAKALKL